LKTTGDHFYCIDPRNENIDGYIPEKVRFKTLRENLGQDYLPFSDLKVKRKDISTLLKKRRK
jgi:hypothetical protein